MHLNDGLQSSSVDGKTGIISKCIQLPLKRRFRFSNFSSSNRNSGKWNSSGRCQHTESNRCLRSSSQGFRKGILLPDANRLCRMHCPDISSHSSGLKFNDSLGMTDWLYKIYLFFKRLSSEKLMDEEGKQIRIKQDRQQKSENSPEKMRVMGHIVCAPPAHYPTVNQI